MDWFSPSTVWGPGMELGSTGLTGSIFASLAASLALHLHLPISHPPALVSSLWCFVNHFLCVVFSVIFQTLLIEVWYFWCPSFHFSRVLPLSLHYLHFKYKYIICIFKKNSCPFSLQCLQILHSENLTTWNIYLHAFFRKNVYLHKYICLNCKIASIFYSNKGQKSILLKCILILTLIQLSIGRHLSESNLKKWISN